MFDDASPLRSVPGRRPARPAGVPTVPPDPAGAATPAEYAQRLRAMMAARRCSLDSVARRSSDAGTPISRATVHNLITATGAPRRDSVLRFLRGCGVPPREQVRWLVAFDQIFPDGRRGVVSRRPPAA